MPAARSRAAPSGCLEHARDRRPQALELELRAARSRGSVLDRIPDRPLKPCAHGPSSAPRGCARAPGSGGSAPARAANVAMYSRKTSSGSWPIRSARRLAAALTSPEPVSASTRAASAASTSSSSTTSSQSSSRRRRAGLELEPRQDRLPRQPVADEARQPQVRGAGDDPLLARGQVEPAAARGDHVVDHVQQLAGAADRVGLDRRDPELLDLVGPAQPAEDLVDVAEVARHEEQERHLALVEPGQVEAGAEHAPPA